MCVDVLVLSVECGFIFCFNGTDVECDVGDECNVGICDVVSLVCIYMIFQMEQCLSNILCIMNIDCDLNDLCSIGMCVVD